MAADKTNRPERIAQEIRLMLGDFVARDEIKDPRVRDAGLITFTHVKVTGDLRQARVSFMVHGLDDKQLAGVRQGLQSASGYLRRLIGDQLRMRYTPTLEFVVDRVFEQEARVDSILREIGKPADPPKE